MMIKFILYALISAFLVGNVTAAVDCSKVRDCYEPMFKTIQARDNVTFTMSYDSYSRIYSNAYGMWEGHQAICNVQNDLQTCLKNGGLEGCINVDDLAKVDFIKNDNPYYYVYQYLRYNYLCAELNNTDRDTFTCVRDYLYSFGQTYENQNRIPSQNCSNYSPTTFYGPDCFTHSIYLDCITNYANSVCGEQSQCMAKKLYTLDMCAYFGGKNQPSCGVCAGPLIGSADYLTNVCTDSNQNNSGSPLSTLSISLLFFVTLVFQLFC